MSPRGLVVMLVRMVEEFYFINLFINIAVDLLLCVVMMKSGEMDVMCVIVHRCLKRL